MNSPIQAVVLAGGFGTRLGERTQSLPKPMMDIGGRPFLDYLIRSLKRHGIGDLVLSVGHLHHTISQCFGDGSDFGVRINYVVEKEPLGTGGAVRRCLSLLAERFFVLNGDTLFDVNFAALAATSDTNVMALRSVTDAGRYGRVEVEGKWITHFEEKGESGPGTINGGVLCLNRVEIAGMAEGRASLEHDLLPRLAEERRIAAFISDAFFIDIGLPQSLVEAQTAIPRWERSQCKRNG